MWLWVTLVFFKPDEPGIFEISYYSRKSNRYIDRSVCLCNPFSLNSNITVLQLISSSVLITELTMIKSLISNMLSICELFVLFFGFYVMTQGWRKVRNKKLLSVFSIDYIFSISVAGSSRVVERHELFSQFHIIL